jgi:alpha-N-arabinofuranosidase
MNVLSSTVALTTSALSATPLSGLDYHQYTRPNYFVSQFNFFDHYSTVHKTLIGEYASIQPNQINRLGADWTAPKNPWSEWIGTIAESIFLIGAERNTDHIIGSCYAPLFQNLNSFQWTVSFICLFRKSLVNFNDFASRI